MEHTASDAAFVVDWSVPPARSRGAVWGEILRRPELARTLGLSDDASDGALAVACYERWGDEAPRHVTGDVAMAVYDAASRQLVAYGDAAASQLLVWTRVGQVAAVANSVRALRTLRTAHHGFGGDLDDDAVAEWLAEGTIGDDRTLARGIRRVRGGTHVRLAPYRTTEGRWWGPPFPADPAVRTEADFLEAFRERLFDAVRDRLRGRDTVVHLSGGLDSAALALVADDLVRSGTIEPRVRTLSFLYPGLDCDERDRIECLRRRIDLPGDLVEAPVAGLDAEAVAAEVHASDSPFVRSQRPSEVAAAALARAAGATAIVTGFGGDELLWDPFSPVELLGEFGRRHLGSAIRARAVRAGLSTRHAARQLLAAAWRRGVRPGPRRERGALPYADELRWMAWTAPALQWRRAWATQFERSAGLQLLCPFYDRRLFELVLGTPIALRPTPTRETPYKPIVVRALGGRFPESFIAPFWKVRFDSYVSAVLARTALPPRGIACDAATRWIEPTGTDGHGRLTWSPGPRTSMAHTLRVWGLIASLDATG